MVDVQQVIQTFCGTFLGILSGEMVSLEKSPVSLDCYRLALGRASSCKILLESM